MTKEEAIKKIYEIAVEIAKTGNFGKISEMNRIACDFEIFVMEDNEYIVVEDDVIYFAPDAL